MYLTEVDRHHPRDADDHEEVELLLESFSKQTEEIVSEVETLSVRAVASESGDEASADTQRPIGQREKHRGHHRAHIGRQSQLAPRPRPQGLHRHAGLDIGRVDRGIIRNGELLPLCDAQATTLTCHSFTEREPQQSPPLLQPFAADLCAPQLTTHLEEHPFAFPGITIVSFALAGAVTMFGLRRLRQMRRVGLGWRGGDSMRLEGDRWGNAARKRLRSPRR